MHWNCCPIFQNHFCCSRCEFAKRKVGNICTVLCANGWIYPFQLNSGCTAIVVATALSLGHCFVQHSKKIWREWARGHTCNHLLRNGFNWMWQSWARTNSYLLNKIIVFFWSRQANKIDARRICLEHSFRTMTINGIYSTWNGQKLAGALIELNERVLFTL